MGDRGFPFRTDGLELDPIYATLRAHEPMSRVVLPYGGAAWLATRYADVRTVLGDPRFSRAATLGADVPRLTRDEVRRGPTIMTMDPPDHTRLRTLISKAFTPRHVEQLRPRVALLVDELLDRMIAAGPPADLIEHLAVPLPVTIICELLGVPVEDHHRFRGWVDAVMATTALSADYVAGQVGQLTAYLGELVARRRAEPADDLVSGLVAARDNDHRLSEDELVNFARSLLIAGQETMANEIGDFAYVLLERPELYQLLTRRPELVPGAVEELLRFVPLGIGDGYVRIATEDLELGGVAVRRGEAVMVSLASANRDESVFDHADAIDFERAENPHVIFGHGPHFCVAASMARMQLQVALLALVTRTPTLALGVAAEELVWRDGARVRGLTALPVRW
jgi:cytochrome P450